MKDKKQPGLRILQLQEVKKEKLLAKINISNDEADLDVKINDMGHLFSIAETIIFEIIELETKIGSGEISKDFARFLANWNETTEIFDEYYQKA